MSDTPGETSNTPGETSNTPEEVSPRHKYFPSDVILDIFLKVTLGRKDSDSSAALTLTIGGLVVSGVVIPLGRWQSLWIQQLTEAAPMLGTALGNAFESLDGDDDDDDDDDWRVNSFVHMRDATIWSGGIRPINLPLWRGQLRHVTGWTLGSLDAS